MEAKMLAKKHNMNILLLIINNVIISTAMLLCIYYLITLHYIPSIYLIVHSNWDEILLY